MRLSSSITWSWFLLLCLCVAAALGAHAWRTLALVPVRPQATDDTAVFLPLSIGRPAPPEPLGRILYTIHETVNNREFFTRLYSVLPDGTDHRQLTTNDDDIQLGRWSPDRQTIAVSRGTPQSPYQIGLLNPNTRTIRPFSTPGVDYVGDISWSPDGPILAFEAIVSDGGFEIMTMNVDGSNLTNLTADLPNGARSPAWTPDGSRIWFQHSEGQGYKMMQMNPDGSDVAVVSDEDFPYYAPDWSPDGRTLLLTGPIPGADFGILTMTVGEHQPTPLLANASFGKWSPNGKQIVFMASGGVFRVDALGQIIAPVVADDNAVSPDW